MTNKIEVLNNIFDPTSQDCQTVRDDLQMALTLNPDLSKVEEAMEEWAKIDSIGFSKWIPLNAYIAEDDYYYCLLENASIVTEEKLYELYQQSKNKIR